MGLATCWTRSTLVTNVMISRCLVSGLQVLGNLGSWSPQKEATGVARAGSSLLCPCFSHSALLRLPLQLDSEDAEPNFDEDGQDEYNELHMPV